MIADPILSIKNLTVSLPSEGDRRNALEAVDLQLFAGERLCIVGESGSGKSMLARAIMQLMPSPNILVTQGEVKFQGLDLLNLSPDRMRRIRSKEIAMIFQEPMTALNPLKTIGAQIVEPLRLHTDLNRSAMHELVLKMLAQVNLPNPESLLLAYPHQLSGGQRQRAMIAMSLILEPKIILADEPTTALDVTTQAQVLSLMVDLQQKRGTSMLFITHDFAVVSEIADRVIVMQHGKVVEVGETAQVLSHPNEPYTRQLIASVPKLHPRRRSLSNSLSETTASLLEVKDLTKAFNTGAGLFSVKRSVQAVSQVDLTLAAGEALGIVGESGSGKSTLARLIIRLIKPDAGNITLNGRDFLDLNGSKLRTARNDIQMVFQDPYGSLNPRQTVRDIVTEGMILRGTSRVDAERQLSELLKTVGLDISSADRHPHQFSGGQRQRIGLARALALKPKILILDEAVSALDVSIQAQVLDLLKDIRDKFGVAMLFITHDLCVASQVCDRILVMRDGKVVEEGDTFDVFTSPQNEYTLSLLEAIPGRDWLSTLSSEKVEDATV